FHALWLRRLVSSMQDSLVSEATAASAAISRICSSLQTPTLQSARLATARGILDALVFSVGRLVVGNGARRGATSLRQGSHQLPGNKANAHRTWRVHHGGGRRAAQNSRRMGPSRVG